MPVLSAAELRAEAARLRAHGCACGGSIERDCEREAKDCEAQAQEAEGEAAMARALKVKTLHG